MPVAQRQQSVLLEDAIEQLTLGEDANIMPPKIDFPVFEQVCDYLDKSRSLQKEDESNLIKLDRLEKAIAQAEEIVSKGETKLEALKERRSHLIALLESKQNRIKEATKYWTDYGLNIEQIHSDSDDFAHYEFTYWKLHDNHPAENQGDSNNPSVGTTDNQLDSTPNSETRYKLGIKCVERKLTLVTQTPQVLDDTQVEELEEKLNATCFNSPTSVDYKQAMVLMRKALLKNLCPQS